MAISAKSGNIRPFVHSRLQLPYGMQLWLAAQCLYVPSVQMLKCFGHHKGLQEQLPRNAFSVQLCCSTWVCTCNFIYIMNQNTQYVYICCTFVSRTSSCLQAFSVTFIQNIYSVNNLRTFWQGSLKALNKCFSSNLNRIFFQSYVAFNNVLITLAKIVYIVQGTSSSWTFFQHFIKCCYLFQNIHRIWKNNIPSFLQKY